MKKHIAGQGRKFVSQCPDGSLTLKRSNYKNPAFFDSKEEGEAFIIKHTQPDDDINQRRCSFPLVEENLYVDLLENNGEIVKRLTRIFFENNVGTFIGKCNKAVKSIGLPKYSYGINRKPITKPHYAKESTGNRCTFTYKVPADNRLGDEDEFQVVFRYEAGWYMLLFYNDKRIFELECLRLLYYDRAKLDELYKKHKWFFDCM